MRPAIYLLIALVSYQAQAASALSAPFNLQVEYLSGPTGVDVIAPRFSWNVQHDQRAQVQSAFQVQVVQSFQDVGKVMWDSNKVSDATQSVVRVAYGSVGGSAVPLESDSVYQWRVRWFDADGAESDFSDYQTFSTGLFNASEWHGQWIGCGGQGNQFRKTVDVPAGLTRASAFISGLGYYELFVNGQRIGDHRLDPGWTTYQKRTLYASYDITEYLKGGQTNTFAIKLGRGWYGQENYDNSTVKLQVNFYANSGTGSKQTHPHARTAVAASSELVSDLSWKCFAGPIVYDDVYNGETYDATKETPGWMDNGFDDSGWHNVVASKVPGGVMKSQLFPAIRKQAEWGPVSIKQPQSGVFVLDFGQHLSGYCRLSLRGGLAAGITVTLKHAEILKPDDSGMIYVAELRGAKATDAYTTKESADPQEYEPSFTYHGFRYVELTGLPYTPDNSTLTAVHFHSDVGAIGDVSFSLPILNAIQHNVVWGQKTNLMSVATDCDNRDERKGWMGDASLTADEAFHNFHMPAFYTNWLNVMRDEQELSGDNSLPDTAPLTFGSANGDPSWGSAYPTILYGMFKYYGDREVIADHFDSLKKYMAWMSAMSQAGPAHFYVEYGDWVPPPESKKVSDQLTAAFSYLKDLQQYGAIATALGQTAEAEWAQNTFKNYSAQFNTAFFDSSINLYDTGSSVQSGQVLPLWLDITPDDTAKASLISWIVNDAIVTHGTHLTTGIIGTKFLPLALSDNGQSNTVLAIAAQTSYPSWGYMITNTIEPATTLWELWNTPTGDPGMDSRNHIMFGSIGHWFYTVGAGLDQDPASVAYGTIQIKPRPSMTSAIKSWRSHQRTRGRVAGSRGKLLKHNQNYIVADGPLLDSASASVFTVRGDVAVSWLAQGDNTFYLNVTVPVSATANVFIPVMTYKLQTVTIAEAGLGQPTVFFKDSAFQGGVAGINSAESLPVTHGGDGPYVVANVGSGSYQFIAQVN